MESDKAKLAVAGMIIIVLLIGIYWLSSPQKTNPLVALNLTKKIQGLDSYTMITAGKIEINVTRGEGVNGSIDSIARVFKNKETARIDTVIVFKTGIVESRTYFLGNETYLCAQTEEWSCIRAESDPEAKKAADNLKLKVLGSPIIAQAYESMFNDGSLVFLDGAVEKSVEGRNCYQLESTVNFAKLSEGNRNSLELAKDTQTYYSTQCIDKDLGAIVSSYAYIVRENTTVGITTLLRGINITSEFANSTFQLPAEATSAYGAGLCTGNNRTALDKCFREEAFNNKDTKLCYDVLNPSLRDDCFLILLPITNDAKICENIANAEVKDACYVEAGALTKDLKICEGILNATLRETCIGII
ncbi:hypothetical protein HY570_02045, partial [Candidatus Micrarchaeota archaeon]|nr:hypothetical protein [Candidatus Micrarchaeota archaeon]